MDGTAATVGASLIAALIGSVLGGGAVARLLYRGHKDQLVQDLRLVFATITDVDAVGGKVTGAVSVATGARERADTNADAIIRLQEAERHRWEPVLRYMERADKRMDKHEQILTRLTTMMDEVAKRLDRHDGRQP